MPKNTKCQMHNLPNAKMHKMPKLNIWKFASMVLLIFSLSSSCSSLFIVLYPDIVCPSLPLWHQPATLQKKDWGTTVKEDLKLLKIEIPIEEIKQILKAI